MCSVNTVPIVDEDGCISLNDVHSILFMVTDILRSSSAEWEGHSYSYCWLSLAISVTVSLSESP